MTKDPVKKQEAEQAIPTSGVDFVRRMRREQESEGTSIVEKKDLEIAALGDMPGWHHLKAVIEKRIENFRTLKGLDLDSVSDDQLGVQVRINLFVAEELQWIVNKVERTREYHDAQSSKPTK